MQGASEYYALGDGVGEIRYYTRKVAHIRGCIEIRVVD